MNVQNLKILFLCTGNSCRSQMAEGWARHLKRSQINVWSAGVESHGLNPYAVQVMREAGVDISHQQSKHFDKVMHIHFDYVITVCDSARESCPLFPGTVKIVHNSFEDPPFLAKNAKTEEEKLNIYRKVRDEIRNYVNGLPESLNANH